MFRVRVARPRACRRRCAPGPKPSIIADRRAARGVATIAAAEADRRCPARDAPMLGYTGRLACVNFVVAATMRLILRADSGRPAAGRV
jgi:hypothetical protein